MKPTPTKTRIVLADDFELFLTGFKFLLQFKDDAFEVVAEAKDGRELVELVAQHLPDVVITDIQMPVMNGIEACREIQSRFPDVKVIGLSMFGNEQYIVDMIEAGAKGYLLKNTTREEVSDAIRMVQKGGEFIGAGTAFEIARLIGKSKRGRSAAGATPHFTERELQIIRLVCEDYSNKEIGVRLGLSQRTIENHRARIQEKIGCRSMAGLIVYAVRNNLY